MRLVPTDSDVGLRCFLLIQTWDALIPTDSYVGCSCFLLSSGRDHPPPLPPGSPPPLFDCMVKVRNVVDTNFVPAACHRRKRVLTVEPSPELNTNDALESQFPLSRQTNKINK